MQHLFSHRIYIILLPTEESELRLASLKSVYENRIEKMQAEIEQLNQSANAEVEKAVEKLQKENEELQAKVGEVHRLISVLA